MPELSEDMYCSQQICIPPTFPYLLRQFAKAAIRTQPNDLLRWSAAYFRCLSLNLKPPVKPRLEYPIPKDFNGLTPGWLKALIYQLQGYPTVPFKPLWDRWIGACLIHEDLIKLLCLGAFDDPFAVPWFRFIALCAGTLTENLTQTMILICEILTEEPEGGSAMIPVNIFIDLYKFLARIDASKLQMLKNYYFRDSLLGLWERRIEEDKMAAEMIKPPQKRISVEVEKEVAEKQVIQKEVAESISCPSVGEEEEVEEDLRAEFERRLRGLEEDLEAEEEMEPLSRETLQSREKIPGMERSDEVLVPVEDRDGVTTKWLAAPATGPEVVISEETLEVSDMMAAKSGSTLEGDEEAAGGGEQQPVEGEEPPIPAPPDEEVYGEDKERPPVEGAEQPEDEQLEKAPAKEGSDKLDEQSVMTREGDHAASFTGAFGMEEGKKSTATMETEDVDTAILAYVKEEAGEGEWVADGQCEEFKMHCTMLEDLERLKQRQLELKGEASEDELEKFKRELIADLKETESQRLAPVHFKTKITIKVEEGLEGEGGSAHSVVEMDEEAIKAKLREDYEEVFVDPIPGIGPIVPEALIEAVVEYMTAVSMEQHHMVMPRNIRHYECPPLEVINY